MTSPRKIYLILIYLLFSLELLELLNRILGHLDNIHLSIDIQKETQDKTQERICGFLKVLGYPSDFNPNF